MKIGMLWFDNSDASLSAKVGRAISYYEQKYGSKPTLAIVNPVTQVDDCPIEIETSRSIMPNHIWIGMKE